MLEIVSNGKRLQEYKLRSNPFPYVGVPEETASIYIARDRELDLIGEAIRGVVEGSSSHLVLVGSYGNGKTKTLMVVKQALEAQLKASVVVPYVSNPGETFLDLYRNLMQDIGEKRLRELVWKILEIKTGKTNLMTKVEKGEILLTAILQKCRTELYEVFGHADFVNALIQLTLDERRFDAWRYLCGEPTVSENRRVLDVVAPINNDERALRAMMSMIKVFSLTGVKVFCVLIDELEAIQLLFPWKKQRLLNNIRRLIDLNPHGLCLIMSCAPDAWSGIISEYHAFSERIFREVILKPLDRDGTKKLVTSYLGLKRTNSDRVVSALYPFTSDAIEEISQTSQGNVRRALMICNRAVDIGSKIGHPEISRAFLRKHLPEILSSG